MKDFGNMTILLLLTIVAAAVYLVREQQITIEMLAKSHLQLEEMMVED